MGSYLYGLLVILLFVGCSKPEPKPDPNIALRRELTAFTVSVGAGMNYQEFRELRQQIETEIALRDVELSPKARSYGTSLRLDFLHVDYFWKQYLLVPPTYLQPRGASVIDKSMMIGLVEECDQYVPRDLVRLGLDKAVKDAQIVLSALTEKEPQ